MLLRIQSPHGCKRIEISLQETTKDLYEKIVNAFGLSSFSFTLHKTRDRKNIITSGRRDTIKSLKLAHGDMIFLYDAEFSQNAEVNGSTSSSVEPMEPTPSTSQSMPTKLVPENGGKMHATKIKSSIKEDPVDEFLGQLDGQVERKRDPTLCRHNSARKCIHCVPLDPWDSSLMKDKNIKHVSFHAYLKKMTSGVDKGKFAYLSDLNCKIIPGCSSHPPWPQGICSKCQPSGVTLNRQEFRHVDNVTFENAQIVENFLHYWRVTGHQRVGLLYGKHQPHLDVPLGIKASVAAIYEPPQEGSRDSVKLLPDPNKEVVEMIANHLELQCVGWIFSDLVSLSGTDGKVKCTRGVDSFFLSAQEVITAGHLQQLYPNPCKLSSSGYFGSKFATVVVTGDKNEQIHMEGYQVSNQCQSLVRDNILIPTRDKPQLAYIKESSSTQYVPDVYFREKDEYGNSIVKLGRPLPVEYLLTDCPVSTPNEPIYTFPARENPFPIENRMVEGHLQDFPAVVKYFGEPTDDEFLGKLRDFHFLVYLATMDMLPLKDCLAPLLDAIVQNNAAAAIEWRKSDEWSTVEQLINVTRSSGTQALPSSGPSSSNEALAWTCAHCTFINQSGHDACDMCHLPRSDSNVA